MSACGNELSKWQSHRCCQSLRVKGRKGQKKQKEWLEIREKIQDAHENPKWKELPAMEAGEQFQRTKSCAIRNENKS